VCSIGWNLKTDEFEPGQWLRGRIYERRADLSPDGKYLIYFAMSAKWGSKTKGSWTAVSRAPWLKALVLLGKGDCWNGGGLFTSNSSYWVNDGYGHFPLQESAKLHRDLSFKPAGYYGGECPSVYYPRLLRDGWTLRTRIENGKCNSCTVFERVHPKKGWVLRKFAHEEVGSPPGKGCYWDEHELEHTQGQRLSHPDWEWADFRDGDVLWAEAGCLHRSPVYSKEIGKSEMLLDTNGMKFEACAAPY
jgi:hypothetical protein